MAPALVVLFGADHKAKQIGALSLATSSYARRAAAEDFDKKSWWQMGVYYFDIIDGEAIEGRRGAEADFCAERHRTRTPRDFLDSHSSPIHSQGDCARRMVQP